MEKTSMVPPMDSESMTRAVISGFVAGVMCTIMVVRWIAK